MNPDQTLLIYTTSWCSDCQRVKYLLDEYGVGYTEIDVDQDPAAAAFVRQVNGGQRRVPTIIFPDQSVLVEPSTRKLADKLGLTLERP